MTIMDTSESTYMYVYSLVYYYKSFDYFENSDFTENVFCTKYKLQP